jgi:hypothetical protein
MGVVGSMGSRRFHLLPTPPIPPSLPTLPTLPTLCALCVLLLALCVPARADTSSRAVLILVPGMDAESFLKALEEPRWGRLRAESGLAVMNAGVPGPDTTESAYFTVGVGQRLVLPRGLPPARKAVPGSTPADRMETGSAHSPGFAAALRKHRRAGGVPVSLGEACRRAGKRVTYIGVVEPSGVIPGLGFLCAADGQGQVPLVVGLAPAPGKAETWAPAWDAGADLVVLDLPPGTSASDALAVTETLAHSAGGLVILTSPNPGEPKGGSWPSLSPVLVSGAGWGGRILTSATTRTPGLLANVDLAPTLLSHLGVPVPSTMEGHAATAARDAELSELGAFARQARITHEAMVPGLLAWGALLLIGVGWVTAVLMRPGKPWSLRVGRGLLALLAAFPVGMLLTAWHSPSSPGALCLSVLGWTILTAGVAVLLGFRSSPLMVVFLFLAAAVLADLYSGGRMLARNLMSDFANIGARFYGIGNEYEGLLMGAALLIPFWAKHLRGPVRFSSAVWLGTSVLWIVSLVGVGTPSLGADFGGAVSFTVAFLIAGTALWALETGRKPRARIILVGLVIVAGVAAAFIALDLMRPPGSRTHVGELAARALGGGIWPVIEIAGRKAWANVQMATSAYFLGGLAAVTPLFYIWYHRLGAEAWSALSSSPALKWGIFSAFAGGLAVLALNDTGVVAWAMVTGCGLFLWLDLMLDRRLNRCEVLGVRC